MSSAAYRRWATARARVLDDVEAAHAALRGTGRGVRLVEQQVIRGYVVLLAAEVQGYYRELHTDATDHFISLVPTAVRSVTRRQFLFNRALDRGNPNPANLGADFGRLGFNFWDELQRADGRVADWKRSLEALNAWRNAIAHSDYDPVKLGGTILVMRQVRRWRTGCRLLARTADRVVGEYLTAETGSRPW